MRASVSNFRRALLLAALLTASVVSAGSRQTETAPAPRPLDRREHCGYESWERLLPTHVKAQYAGGMGFLSAGYGWDYGRKCRWETDMMIGVLPKAYSDRTHMTFTLKQNYIPWSIRCGERFAVETPVVRHLHELHLGRGFWIREPDRYPGDQYYNFTSRLRFHLYVGQRFTFYLKGDSLLRHITLFYEFSANDWTSSPSAGTGVSDWTKSSNFSVGIKFQLFRANPVAGPSAPRYDTAASGSETVAPRVRRFRFPTRRYSFSVGLKMSSDSS